MSAAYPATSRERDEWILARRPGRNVRDPWRPYAFHLENERTESGDIAALATIFLTNRECPWRCVMCDLWRDTLTETVPPGAIPAQIDFALGNLRPAVRAKLYNAGSFFDERAIPVSEHAAIADRFRGFERVTVECHPSLVGEPALRFHEMLGGTLEVALGLETSHPEVLQKLNKRVTLERFERATAFLRRNGIPFRVFVLVQPPFLQESESLEWAFRSIDFALGCGAGVVSLIPTRGGNGAMEALADGGQFTPPRLQTLEAAVDYGIGAARNIADCPRVFADLWDFERLSSCAICSAARRDRLERINLEQKILPGIRCACEN